MQLHQASFRAIALQRLKCLWTLMIQHFKRAAHVWHSRALGQEEKACFNGKCFICRVVLFYSVGCEGCVVWVPWVPLGCPTAASSKTCDEKQVFKQIWEHLGSEHRCEIHRCLAMLLSDMSALSGDIQCRAATHKCLIHHQLVCNFFLID